MENQNNDSAFTGRGLPTFNVDPNNAPFTYATLSNTSGFSNQQGMPPPFTQAVHPQTGTSELQPNPAPTHRGGRKVAYATLLPLPLLRPLVFSPGVNMPGPDVPRRSEKEYAHMVYTRGTIPAHACIQCTIKEGAFNECVVMDGRLAGACANCKWNSSANRCSFYDASQSYRRPRSKAPKSNLLNANSNGLHQSLASYPPANQTNESVAELLILIEHQLVSASLSTDNVEKLRNKLEEARGMLGRANQKALEMGSERGFE